MTKNTFLPIHFINKPLIYKFLLIILSICCIVSTTTILPAQTVNTVKKTSEGTEFWVCFQENSWHHALERVGKMKLTDPRGQEMYVEDRSISNFELFLSSDTTTRVRIEIVGIRYKLDTMVIGGSVRRLKIPSSAEVTGDGTLQPNAVRVTSDSPISVTCLNERGSSTDSYLALPSKALGLEYYTISYHSTPTNDLVPHMAIIATKDSTIVKVTPSFITSRNRPAGVPFTVIMNKGDVYQIAASNMQGYTKTERGTDSIINPDISGTRVQATKPVAVFSGHQCADIPMRVPFCNYLVEQVPPVNSWGMHFILGKFAKRSSYAYRVIASTNNTKIFENSVLVKELQAGQMYENSSAGSRNIMLTASSPVLVAQFSHGYLGGVSRTDGKSTYIRGDSIGDPMMLVVSPTQQFLREYRFATPKTSFTNWRHFINIVIPSSAVGSLRLNGRVLDTVKNYPEFVGLSSYVCIQTDIPFGVHTVKADVPFGLYSYGFATNDAYGNMIGQGFDEIEEIRDSLPPTFERRNLDKKINLVIRDDKSTDKGLQSIRIISAVGLAAMYGNNYIDQPSINPGTPQYTMFVRPLNGFVKGKMEIEAKDLSGNISTYTLDYDGTNFLGALEEKPVPDLSKITETWLWGSYAIASSQYHTLNNVQTIGSTSVTGQFEAESGSPLGLGFRFNKYVGSSISVSLKAEYLPCSIVLRGRDSLLKRVYDSVTNQYLNYQEAFVLQPTLPMISFSTGIEYQLHPLLYTFVDIQSSIILSKSAESYRQIESPLSYAYAQSGTRELPISNTGLDQVKMLWLSANAGIGIQKKIQPHLILFGETSFNYTLHSVLQNGYGEWNYSSLRFSLGFKTSF